MEGAEPGFPAWAAGAAGAGASPAVGHQPGGKCWLRNTSIPIHEFWSPPNHTTAGHPQPRTLCEPAQAAGSFCRVPVTAGIPWGASARWCFTHSKRDIYFVKKNPNKPESHRHVLFLGLFLLGTGIRAAPQRCSFPSSRSSQGSPRHQE